MKPRKQTGLKASAMMLPQILGPEFGGGFIHFSLPFVLQLLPSWIPAV